MSESIPLKSFVSQRFVNHATAKYKAGCIYTNQWERQRAKDAYTVHMSCKLARNSAISWRNIRVAAWLGDHWEYY